MMARTPKFWTDERIQHLRTLWAEGHSTEAIGRKMGISKNAVVGKAHRLNLPARPSPIKRQTPRPPSIPRQGRKPSLPALQVLGTSFTASSSPVRVQSISPQAEITRPAPRPVLPVREKARPTPAPEQDRRSSRVATCCWPIGEPGRPGFGFCGQPVAAPNRPYCDDHCDLAYVKKTVRRRDLEDDTHAIA